MSVSYPKFFVGARRAFATSARFGLACAEERKSSGPGTAICLLQQPEPAAGAGQALPCGWGLPWGRGAKACLCPGWMQAQLCAPKHSMDHPATAFALLALIQVLKRALPSIYLTQCLLVEVFIHK